MHYDSYRELLYFILIKSSCRPSISDILEYIKTNFTMKLPNDEIISFDYNGYIMYNYITYNYDKTINMLAEFITPHKSSKSEKELFKYISQMIVDLLITSNYGVDCDK